MIRTYVDAGSGSYVIVGVIAALAVFAVGWTVLVNRAKRRDAERTGKPQAASAPTGKLWVGGILIAYGLFSLGVAQAAPVVLVVGIVVLGLGFQDRRRWHETQRPALAAGWHDDPESPSRLRYHDGNAWTDRTADKATSEPTA